MSDQARPEDGTIFGEYLKEAIEAGFGIAEGPHNESVKTYLKVGNIIFDIPEDMQATSDELDVPAIKKLTTKKQYNKRKCFLNKGATTDKWS